ncbi:glutaredoxin 3 [Thalassoporum mexicanum PCC 7367]|uniref:glutaredoxin 3 n=1 Tax=Thalassoporum mexicanum TaxID=3457544 RepID=UPI00029FBF07|nr:glutaredoxin 3 [Pseudanabaena sp. PCC 7367]AFY68771.1 glutaredoxin 3 [Pseudanabaena sp. PCC 7367]
MSKKVEIYVWSRCPFCIRAKSLLDQKGIDYIEHVIDGDEQAREQMVARGSDGKRSVPQIFVDDQHIPGGFDGISTLDRQGKLDALLV